MDQAEFDQFADEYYAEHARNIAVSGEAPEFFHRYKVEDLRAYVPALGPPATILDFGAGVGNSIAHFRRAFPTARLICADVSQRSLDVAAQRHPEAEMVLIGSAGLPIAPDSVDLAFAACVFHHIDHADHAFWFQQMLSVVRPGGLLVVFEHNPFNPLTQWAVNTCAFDKNARLIAARALRARITDAGWRDARVRYRLFFPRILAGLRGLETHLAWLPLGAQYHVAAWKP